MGNTNGHADLRALIGIVNGNVTQLSSKIDTMDDKLDAWAQAMVTQESCNACQKHWIDKRGVLVAGSTFTFVNIVIAIIANVDKLLRMS